MSLPARERGLKRDASGIVDMTYQVAPRAGAWIETLCYNVVLSKSLQVAPRAGAWIETSW